MAFFQSVKRILGFGDDYEEEVGIDATVHPRSLNRPTDHLSTDETTPDDETPQASVQAAPAVPVDKIFEHVIDIFNSALPDFLARSVDPEKQRKAIYDSLDSSIKEHISRLADDASKESAIKWHEERKKLITEIETIKGKVQRAEESESESKSRHLSAERQKRALTERIHDLETQIAQLESDKEQYELENKSLVNKIRVNSVQDGDNDALRQEIAELKENIQQLTLKLELAETMAKESNSIAATAKQELKEQQLANERQQADAISLANEKTEINDKLKVAQTEIEELTLKLKNATEELFSTREELDGANQSLALVEEIQSQIERFEEVKQKKDKRIEELLAENNRLTENHKILEDECRSLKNTIERNLASQARTESELTREIERLKTTVTEQNTTDNNTINEPVPEFEAPKPRQKRKKQPVKISAIDESLDNTDWLVATPPEGTSLRQQTGMESSEEFGYKEPAKKNPPENEAQMSLW